MNPRYVEKYPVLHFTVLAYIISWFFWIGIIILEPSFLILNLLFILGGFGPFFSAVIMIRITKGKSEVIPWLKKIFKVRIGIRWYILSFLLPIIVALLSFVFMIYIGGYSLDFTVIAPLGAYPVLLIYIFFLGGGQEEPGWRGFALPKLLKKYSPFLASLIIGLIWAFWHTPLFFLEGAGQMDIPFFWYIINTFGLTLIFTVLYLNSWSVLPAMILHAGVNAVSVYIPFEEGISAVFPYLTISTWIIAVIMIVGLEDIRTFIFKKRRLEDPG